jgi:acetolactate synthase-1/3 small subunit
MNHPATSDPDAVPPRHHTLSVLVENKFGVLARVAGLFARRGYNIYSLAVAPTEDDAFSRITIVVDVESAPLDQVTKQLFKLINVVRIQELAPGDAIERELLLATVQATPDVRQQILELVSIFDGKVLDVGHNQLTVSIEDLPERLDDFEELLRPYGIENLQRTGRIALAKLNKTLAAIHQTESQAS